MPLIRFSRRTVACALLAVSACAPTASWAWGAQGHRITGLVADEFLTPRARIAVRDLLDGETLADASTWMDQEKRHLGPAKAQWHYTNQSVCGSPAVRCPKGNCLTNRLPGLTEEVSDLRLSHAQRAAALRMVIHLVGDLHQPLHMADNDDRGGNDLTVLFPGARKALERNLHEVWDVELVKRELRGISEEKYAQQLVASAKADLGPIRRGGPSEWAAHSYALAREIAYADLPAWRCGVAAPTIVTLDERYVTTGRAAVRTQLRDAGVRLAQVFNGSFGG